MVHKINMALWMLLGLIIGRVFYVFVIRDVLFPGGAP